jgi:hypothetical protein
VRSAASPLQQVRPRRPSRPDRAGRPCSASPRGRARAGAAGSLDKELEQILKNRSAVVVQSSRVGEGRIVRNNNWYEPGMVAADNLSPQKAAILLALALIKTSDPDEIQRMFDEY